LGLFKYINTPLGGVLAWFMILYELCLKHREKCVGMVVVVHGGGGGSENLKNSVLTVLMYLNSPFSKIGPRD